MYFFFFSFSGNSAVKILTNNDIQARINDFYDVIL